jgi:hypothetical protein
MEDRPFSITVDRALSPKDLAQVLGVSEKTARKIFNTIPTFRIGKRKRTSWEAVKKRFFDKAA